MTIDDAFKTYMLHKKSIGIRASTLENNMYIYDRKIKPILGSVDINDIDKALISEAFDTWKENYQLPTIKTIKKVLSAFFNFLINEEILIRNPCKAIKLAHHTADTVILTDDEVKALIRIARATDINLYCQVLLLVTTGVRHGEMDGLQWEDIDFANRTISIRRTFRNSKEGAVKTKTSLRIIPIISKLSAALLKQQKEVKEKFGPCKWVFPGRTGKPLSAARFCEKLSALLAKAGLPHVTVHSLRHYHTTYLLDKEDMPVVAIKERLGWSSATMLLDRYGHVTRNQRHRLIQHLEEDY